MPLAEKPVASSVSGLFEGRKNAYRSKDAKALFRGSYKTRTLFFPINSIFSYRKAPFCGSVCHGTTGRRFFYFSQEGDRYAQKKQKRRNRTTPATARELQGAHAA